MLTTKNNEQIMRTGPGTPMGEYLRRFWIPALRRASSRTRTALPSAYAPRRGPHRLPHDLRALSASLQNSCPHRGASMFFGRNEEEGLRCVYHGWKFDIDRRLRRHAVGAGREQLPEQGAHPRLPDAERGGIIWAYMGPPELAARAARLRMDPGAGGPRPRQPPHAGVQLPAGASRAASTPPTCHSCTACWTRSASSSPAAEVPLRRQGPAPAESNDGVRLRLRRRAQRRGRQLLLAPDALPLPLLHGHPRLHDHAGPAARTRTRRHSPTAATAGSPWTTRTAGCSPIAGTQPQAWTRAKATRRTYVDLTTASFQAIGQRPQRLRPRPRGTAHETFTGIPNGSMQDAAVQETMGAIFDRSKEHLGTSERDHPPAQHVPEGAATSSKAASPSCPHPGRLPSALRLGCAQPHVPFVEA